jgi:hypothetical protein
MKKKIEISNCSECPYCSVSTVGRNPFCFLLSKKDFPDKSNKYYFVHPFKGIRHDCPLKDDTTQSKKFEWTAPCCICKKILTLSVPDKIFDKLSMRCPHCDSEQTFNVPLNDISEKEKLAQEIINECKKHPAFNEHNSLNDMLKIFMGEKPIEKDNNKDDTTKIYWNNQRMFTLEQMKDCFEESRLTHPMIGFKHNTFEEYIKTVK